MKEPVWFIGAVGSDRPTPTTIKDKDVVPGVRIPPGPDADRTAEVVFVVLPSVRRLSPSIYQKTIST